MLVTMRNAVLLLLAQALPACGGGGGGGTAAPPVAVPPPPASVAWGGRYVGTVTIGDVDYYGDALITADSKLRMYVGGPYSADGSVQQTRPDDSAQFVGSIEVQGSKASGNGEFIGQGCEIPGHTRFCHVDFHNMTLALDSGDIHGHVRVKINHVNENWSLNLQPWDNYYALSARVESIAGEYTEELAEFAIDGDTIVNIDIAGRLFFQSPNSGCIGNGIVTPHLDGKFNVYDVDLTVENCNGPYDNLNEGHFVGFATTSPGSYWDYDSLLRIWLSRQDYSDYPWDAFMMSGRPF